ncbi:hypothetical protein ATCC90586_002435 [Pythium insidiosum]|nr:hypothetical protein ATCC90586_002435 [Pythium insidiosum]
MSRAPSADATAATRLAAVTMEPKVLERIIALLPMDSACHAIGEATALLQTVAAICRSLPADFDDLVRHIGPENRAFWQGMVLRCFDFTVNSRVTFNVKDHYVTHREYDPNASELLRAAYREWEATHPDDGFGFMMLSESLAYWTHFNVYFHPKQYGFLRKIQYGELGLDAWPDHEDPFTLFCDLALLKDKFPPFRGHMRTHSHDCQTVHPVLLSPYRNEISQADEAFLHVDGLTQDIVAQGDLSMIHYWRDRHTYAFHDPEALLPIAARWGRLDALQYLLNLLDCNRIEDATIQTAVMASVENGQLDVVCFLVNQFPHFDYLVPAREAVRRWRFDIFRVFVIAETCAFTPADFACDSGASTAAQGILKGAAILSKDCV